MNRSEISLLWWAVWPQWQGVGFRCQYIGFLGGNDPVQRLEFAKPCWPPQMAAPEQW